MTHITSIDALIDRIKEAYPAWEEATLLRIREFMNVNNFALVYSWIDNCWSGFQSFSPEEVLAILDEDGKPDDKRLSELIARAREICEIMARQPLRVKLAEDFRESYDFEPAYWD